LKTGRRIESSKGFNNPLQDDEQISTLVAASKVGTGDYFQSGHNYVSTAGVCYAEPANSTTHANDTSIMITRSTERQRSSCNKAANYNDSYR
jgi:hypothetical protein